MSVTLVRESKLSKIASELQIPEEELSKIKAFCQELKDASSVTDPSDRVRAIYDVSVNKVHSKKLRSHAEYLYNKEYSKLLKQNIDIAVENEDYTCLSNYYADCRNDEMKKYLSGKFQDLVNDNMLNPEKLYLAIKDIDQPEVLPYDLQTKVLFDLIVKKNVLI